MIILFGVKSYMANDFIYTNRKCRHCGSEDSITVLPYHKYFHIFGIPVVPIGKEYEITCHKCDSTLNEYQVDVEDIKKSVRTPFWTFTGLIIIIIFAGSFIIKNAIDKSAENNALREMIENPTKGSILEVKDDKGQYTFFGITNYTNDSVYVRIYSRSAKDENSLKYLWLHKGSFSENEVGFTKQEMLILIDKGILLRIYSK